MNHGEIVASYIIMYRSVVIYKLKSYHNLTLGDQALLTAVKRRKGRKQTHEKEQNFSHVQVRYSLNLSCSNGDRGNKAFPREKVSYIPVKTHTACPLLSFSTPRSLSTLAEEEKAEQSVNSNT